MATQTVEGSSRSSPRTWQSSSWLGNYFFDGCCNGFICDISIDYFEDS